MSGNMNHKKINKDCPCSYDCIRHGDCEACQTNHKGGLTTCQRLNKENNDK